MLHQSITSAQLVHFETSFENEKLPGLRRSQQEEEEEEAKEEEEKENEEEEEMEDGSKSKTFLSS